MSLGNGRLSKNILWYGDEDDAILENEKERMCIAGYDNVKEAVSHFTYFMLY